MTWSTEDDRCVIRCDGDGCAEKVDALDFMLAAQRAVARGWYVPDSEGDDVANARDYCAAHRPARTVVR